MKRIVPPLIAILIVTMAFGWYKIQDRQGFAITLHNKGHQDVRNLVIEYPSGPKVVSVKADSKKKIKVKPNNFGEASIDLIYKTKDVDQMETIFGYIESGYSGKAAVTIEFIKDNGELVLSVEGKTNLY